MIDEQEKLIFIKELGRLIQDFQKCEKNDLQEEIYKDILHLIEVIH